MGIEYFDPSEASEEYYEAEYGHTAELAEDFLDFGDEDDLDVTPRSNYPDHFYPNDFEYEALG